MWILKRSLFAVLILLAACADGKSTDHDTKKTLDNDAQKASYVMGRNIAEQMRHSKLPLDLDSFIWGLHDGYADAKPPMDPKELVAAVDRLNKKLRARAKAEHDAEAGANETASEAFLKKNAARDSVKVTKSGLQYEVVKAGDGPKPKADDVVKVSYRGTLVDGTEFDSSEKHGKPAQFPVNAVIPGWSEALQMMPVGSEWKLYIPPKLAYGAGGTGPIGPNQALIFDVKLLGIEKNKQ